jgi:hypothetical protein
MCLTKDPGNRVEVECPPGYRESDYVLLLRAIAHGEKKGFLKLSPIETKKTDTNNSGGVSTDFIGRNYDYPHKNWQLGFIWTLQHSAKVPDQIRKDYGPLGLAKDEFPDTGHWPPELYIREARRMVGDYVETEQLVVDSSSVRHPVGLGSYRVDSHNVQLYADAAGHVCAEGNVDRKVAGPYRIDYGCLVPKAAECSNLLVPVCLSASHVAYGSIRMEPVFMTLGQSAGTAAALALDEKVPVQEVDYAALKARLLADGQVLAPPK